MEHWSISLSKQDFKFSAAHFLIFPDGTAERLHGHNYRVYVDVAAVLCEHGLVVDFKLVKPVIREMCGELDEHWLVPGEHPVLEAKPVGGNVEVRYQERFYTAPDEDVIVMPMNNVSAENLSTWFGRELRRRLGERFPDLRVDRLMVAVEETLGQRGEYHYTNDETRDG